MPPQEFFQSSRTSPRILQTALLLVTQLRNSLTKTWIVPFRYWWGWTNLSLYPWGWGKLDVVPSISKRWGQFIRHTILLIDFILTPCLEIRFSVLFTYYQCFSHAVAAIKIGASWLINALILSTHVRKCRIWPA